MAGNVNEGGSSSLEKPAIVQSCPSDEVQAEWRSCEQVENGNPSTSPSYWDIDEDDDTGPKPSELYGKFTWKIENFSQISKRELRSNAFEVGGYKWYILIYPQGCDVCNHLSLFLCVANHDKLLPGWSHFAQFTIAVVNKDPKKSKYSDTLHRFWKKEHDWGWKKFIELSKVIDGFIVADTLVIKAQVQVIREKAHHPFRCLDCQYRRELVRVYLSNVEQICRCFFEETRNKLCKLIEDRAMWSSFRHFWLGVDHFTRQHLSRDKTDAILKVVVKNFFIEKEVTSTLVMDSLYNGLKVLKWQSDNKKGETTYVEMEEMPASIIRVEDDMFVLTDDALVLLERTVFEPLPTKDDKGTQRQSQSQNQNQNRTKDGNSSEEFNRDSIERDEKRLTELGLRTLELFVLAHICSSRIEVAYQEVVSLKRQEELIREEEAAGLAESGLRAKRSASEKEKRSKKKQSKQRRNNRKGKDRGRDEKPDDKDQKRSPLNKLQSEVFSTKPDESSLIAVETLDVSDVSDIGVEVAETLDLAHEDRDATPRKWDLEVSEVNPETQFSSSEPQNEQMEKKIPSTIDDSSSTCSTDSVPSVVMNGTCSGNLLHDNNGFGSSSRGKSRSSKATHSQTTRVPIDIATLPSGAAIDAGQLQDAPDCTGISRKEPKTVVISKDRVQLRGQHVGKQEEVMYLLTKSCVKDEASQDASSKAKIGQSLTSPNTSIKNASLTSQQQRKNSENKLDADKSVAGKQPPDTSRQIEKSASWPRQTSYANKPEMQRFPTAVKVVAANEASLLTRPCSAPLVPSSRSAASVVSTVQTTPLLSQSVIALNRFGATEALPASHSNAPQSYRNVIMGKSSTLASSSGFDPNLHSSSSSQSSLFSQSAASVVTSSPTVSINPRSERNLIRPGLALGSMNAQISNNGDRWTEGHLQQEWSSNIWQTSSLISNTIKLNIHDSSCHWAKLAEEATSGASIRPTQIVAADEFPHLDIINYLLDEEYVDGKISINGHNQFTLNRQYNFPGSLATADILPLNNSFQLDGPEQYHGETTQGMYGSTAGPFDEEMDLCLPQIGPSAYTSCDMDGWMILNPWPLGAPELGLGTLDCDVYPYQLQAYPNLACGVNEYTL